MVKEKLPDRLASIEAGRFMFVMATGRDAREDSAEKVLAISERPARGWPTFSERERPSRLCELLLVTLPEIRITESIVGASGLNWVISMAMSLRGCSWPSAGALAVAALTARINVVKALAISRL